MWLGNEAGQAHSGQQITAADQLTVGMLEETDETQQQDCRQWSIKDILLYPVQMVIESAV